MKTIRDRWSSSGQASRCSGGWTTCWTPFRSRGPCAADVQQPLDAQQVASARLEQHRQPDPERGPVEPLLEDEREGPDAALVRVPLPHGDVARVRARPVEEAPGLDLAERGLDDLGAGVERAQSRLEPVRLGHVHLGHNEHVGDRRLLQRLVLDEAVERVHGGHDPVQLEVVPDDRLGDQRVDDRRRVGQARSLDDDAAERRDLPPRPPAVQVAELVREVAAQRAADAARVEQHRPLVDPPEQMVVDPDLAQLVDDHGRLAHVRMRQQARDQRRLPRAEEPCDQRDGRLHSAASRAGSSGSSGRPASFSASPQSVPMSVTTAERPLRSRSV